MRIMEVSLLLVPYRLPKKIPINHKDLWEFLFYTGKKFAFLKTYLYLCNISIIV